MPVLFEWMVPLTLGQWVRLHRERLPLEWQWPPRRWEYRTRGALLLEPRRDASQDERVGVHEFPRLPVEQDFSPLFV